MPHHAARSAGALADSTFQYDPVLGRFVSLDPLFEATSPHELNGLSYADDDPVTNSDPTGKRLYDPDTTCNGTVAEVERCVAETDGHGGHVTSGGGGGGGGNSGGGGSSGGGGGYPINSNGVGKTSYAPARGIPGNGCDYVLIDPCGSHSSSGPERRGAVVHLAVLHRLPMHRRQPHRHRCRSGDLAHPRRPRPVPGPLLNKVYRAASQPLSAVLSGAAWELCWWAVRREPSWASGQAR
ncbi:RHS repeat-associated core domain-containing protein [Streptomyces sp. NPDC049687]|uniref:RHS repeat-associated core domain-containing protein n=1 Tax=Streptomyces sp. NPDC049687 TaxID=3365596 RepID=UPI0037B287B4